MNAHYPNLSTPALRVLLSVAPGSLITAEAVGRVTGRAADFPMILAELDRVHFVDENCELTPVADRYASMTRQAHISLNIRA